MEVINYTEKSDSFDLKSDKRFFFVIVHKDHP